MKLNLLALLTIVLFGACERHSYEDTKHIFHPTHHHGESHGDDHGKSADHDEKKH